MNFNATLGGGGQYITGGGFEEGRESRDMGMRRRVSQQVAFRKGGGLSFLKSPLETLQRRCPIRSSEKEPPQVKGRTRVC